MITVRTFDTPQPIVLSLEIGAGNIWIEATDRSDTSVDIRPTVPAKPADVASASQANVEHTTDRVHVKAQSGWRQWRSRRGESIDVTVGLPTGSRLVIDVGVASVRSSGRVGDVRCKVGVGDIDLDEAGPIDLKTGVGDVRVERAVGPAHVVTGSGSVRLGAIEGTLSVKNSNGETSIDEVAGEARVRAANGAISIGTARAGVVAKTANGDVRLGEVSGSAAVAESAFGDLEVGVRDGIAAWLDLHTRFGNVRNDLESSAAPGADDEKIEVRALTSYGDITIHRSVASVS